MWSKCIIIFVVFLSVNIDDTEQRGDGAPAGACLDQMPSHSGIQPQGSVPPYVIVTSSPQVHQGDTIDVTITSPGGRETPVGGFILQARQVQNQDKILGQFVSVPDTELERITSCRGNNDTVTHNTPDDKYGLRFKWKAPQNYLGGVFFRATIAQTYAEFWKNVESPVVEVVTPDTVITTTAAPARRPQTTYIPELPTRKAQQQDTTDEIYRGCDVTKLCFGSPSNCVASRNCKSIVSVLVKSESYVFELQATGNPVYVAAGLSMDKNMGYDSAMECVQRDGTVRLYSSWTYPKEDPFVTRKGVPQDILRLETSSYIDGKLYCRFSRDPLTEVMGNKFDMINNKYHLLIVSGSSMKDEGRVGYHDLTYERTETPIALSMVQAVEGSSKLFIKLHGALMVFAWLGTASIGIIMARYFRQTWVGQQFFGKDIWFAWHRLLMFLTVVITIAANVLIVLEVGGYTTTGDNPHAITGLVTVILAILQPIGAFFRPHPGTSKRPVFNWLHWLMGNAAHILAIATIFLAVYLTKAELPGWTLYILVVYVAVHVFAHLILSVSTCMSEGKVQSRVNSFPLKDMINTRGHNVLPSDTGMDSRYSGFRRSILGIYICLISLLVIAVICLVSLAPFEAKYNTITTSVLGG